MFESVSSNLEICTTALGLNGQVRSVTINHDAFCKIASILMVCFRFYNLMVCSYWFSQSSNPTLIHVFYDRPLKNIEFKLVAVISPSMGVSDPPAHGG